MLSPEEIELPILPYVVLHYAQDKFIFINYRVVRVPGYRSIGPGFDSRHYQIF
jgi:hypothetical protein